MDFSAVRTSQWFYLGHWCLLQDVVPITKLYATRSIVHGIVTNQLHQLHQLGAPRCVRRTNDTWMWWMCFSNPQISQIASNKKLPHAIDHMCHGQNIVYVGDCHLSHSVNPIAITRKRSLRIDHQYPTNITQFLTILQYVQYIHLTTSPKKCVFSMC